MPNDFLVTLEHEETYVMTSPDYRITIPASGEATFETKRKTPQSHRIALSPDELEALYAQIESAAFFEMAPEYVAPISDLVWVVVTVTAAGRTHQVRHYTMGLVENDAGPRALLELESTIEQLVNAKCWQKS